MSMQQGTATRELRYGGIGNRDPGDIWGTRDEGVFVVVSSRPAMWRGEDRDVYAHVDTWYTLRPATEAEQALWDAAVEAASARKALRRHVGATSSHTYDSASRKLVCTMRALDSYDDRWEPPADIVLDDSGVAIEEQYLTRVAALKGHN